MSVFLENFAYVLTKCMIPRIKTLQESIFITEINFTVSINIPAKYRVIDRVAFDNHKMLKEDGAKSSLSPLPPRAK